jgi:hypothetical protein
MNIILAGVPQTTKRLYAFSFINFKVGDLMKDILKAALLCFLLVLSACSESNADKVSAHKDMTDKTHKDMTDKKSHAPKNVVNSINEVELIYAGNIQGELEPCGCTPETDFGGILRHSTGLMNLRQQFPRAFTIAAGGLLDKDASTQKIKNQYIILGFSEMAYDAIGLQWRDLVFGEELLKSDPALPWISSNYPRSSFVKNRVIARGDQQLLVFALLDPADFALMSGREQFQQLTDGLLATIKQVRTQNQLVLVLLSPKMQNWLPILQDQVDFIVLPTGAEQFEAPRALSTKTWLLQPGHRGMYLGAAKFLRSSQGEWQLQQNQILPLSSSVANDAKLQPWYDQYNEAVRAAYQQEVAIKKQILGESPYVGADACIACHQAAYAVWQKSAHAHALDKLKAVNKAFDPECVSCHVVGLQQSGGFIDESTTPHLANVQCENCHGPRRDHIKQPGLKTEKSIQATQLASEKNCLTCHNAEHSPKFDFKKYWPLIQHQ